jgi:tyrosyl-tRNA synthetase
VLTPEDLLRKLEQSAQSGAPLVVKYGVDPTAPEMHLGHLVPLRKLRQFQEFGHDVAFLIGDFTARIGDPSGRGSGRAAMSEEEVLSNAQTYCAQLEMVLDMQRTRVVYNSAWLKPLTLEETIQLLARSTVNALIKRKSFVKRLDAGNAIAGHELVYPYLQAYDSVALHADVELGGSDQFFNLVFGRDLQVRYAQAPQVVLTTPLLEGLDGKAKMSKSLGNTVGLQEPAHVMYAKLMRVPDELVGKYARLLTARSEAEITSIETTLRDTHDEHALFNAKHLLATDVTTWLHGASETKQARDAFERARRGDMPLEMPIYRLPSSEQITLREVVYRSGLAPSKNAAQRLIVQRGLQVDGVLVDEPTRMLAPGECVVLRAGKNRYVRIEREP